MNLGQLIEALGPLNNQFRDSRGVDRIAALRKMGEVIHRASDGPMDRLLWEIQQKSFITRDVLRYSSIVYRAWPDEDTLRTLFTGVRHYTVFREALPFLKGDRAGISEEDYQKVMRALNMDDKAEAVACLSELKAKYIGRQKRKGVSRDRVMSEIETTQAFLDNVKAEVTKEPQELLNQLRSQLGDIADLLSRVVYALVSDSDIPDDVVKTLAKQNNRPLVEGIARVVGGHRDIRAAYTKAVGPSHLIRLADLLGSLGDDEAFRQWEKRARLSF